MNNSFPIWDLSAYYSGPTDPKIDTDIIETQKKSEEFERKHRGKVTDQTAPEYILAALQEYEEINLQASKPVFYAQNLNSVDSTDPQNGALLQKTMKAVMGVSSSLTFFSLELNNLSVEKIKSLAESDVLKNYRHYLERLIEFKPHRLSEKEEIIFQQKSLTSSHAFARLFDQHQSEKKYVIEIEGKKEELNQSQVLDLMRSADRDKRKLGSETLSNGLAEDIRLYAFIINTLVTDKEITDKFAKFTTPEQSRHLDNDVNQELVETMVSVVNENLGLVEDFYLAKKEWLGVDELFDYDRYAPLHESTLKYDYEKAKEIVLQTFTKFSPDFGHAASLFFEKNWIHAPTQAGKRGGAYCSGGTPDKHPVILLNYRGRLDDVSTMAHELGHGVNDLMMQVQTPINYDTTLVLAETASVFAEMLLFDEMKQRISDPKEKFSLYVEKIEGIFATVFRQISMFKFEQKLHGSGRTKGELSVDDINELWMVTQTQMYGKSVTFTPGYKFWWSYIQHFYHWPFYVYAYAFGELLVLALYAKYKQEGQAFVPKYLELMRAGTTDSPQALLKPLGIDLSDRKFWQAGMDMIRELIRETKQLGKR